MQKHSIFTLARKTWFLQHKGFGETFVLDVWHSHHAYTKDSKNIKCKKLKNKYKKNMTRVKRGNVARKRRKKVLKMTQGFRGSSSVLFRVSNQQYFKGLRYSFRDRQQRKRNFRSLWIVRVNAAARNFGLSYSRFLNKLKNSNMELNRKILAQIAVRDQAAFSQLLKEIN